MPYIPSCPLPSYAYIPGKNPRHVDLLLPPVPASYRGINDPEFLARFHFGIDCFNHEFYWETHEALEGLWHLVGRQTSDVGKALQSIILLSAAHLKTFCQDHQNVRAWSSARSLINNIDQKVFADLGIDGERYRCDLDGLLALEEQKRARHSIILNREQGKFRSL
jgi:hypothetical protein